MKVQMTPVEQESMTKPPPCSEAAHYFILYGDRPTARGVCTHCRVAWMFGPWEGERKVSLDDTADDEESEIDLRGLPA